MNVRVQVQLMTVSGLPEDRPTNVWHFVTDGLEATHEDITNELEQFYNALNTRFGETIAQTNHIAKFYDLADPSPRAPIYTGDIDFASAPTGDSLPTEVCLCLSFQGLRVSGEDQRRRRGRVYIGPFAAGQQDTSGVGRPSAGLISALATAGQELLVASNADPAWSWQIWSPTDAAMVQVTDGWVDNAWDIQRRRGLAATGRTTFATP